MSARDRFKAANMNFVSLGSEANKETIVDDIVNNLNATAEESSSVPEIERPLPAPVVEETPKNIKIVTPKRKPGRPRKFKEDEKTEVIGVRLLAEEVRFLEEYGGKYGGKTGYVTHLVRQEMERIKSVSQI